MIKYCLKKWDENKDKLERAYRRMANWKTREYEHIVKMTVKYILNAGEEGLWDIRRITEVDNGEYQGCLLYLIPENTYQPNEYEYLMTYVDYGSCTGCDTLLRIQGEADGDYPSDGQVQDFMIISRDIISHIIKPYNHGWRHKDEFDMIEDSEGAPTIDAEIVKHGMLPMVWCKDGLKKGREI